MQRHAGCLMGRAVVHTFSRKIGLVFAVALCAASANAITLDWDIATWANGSLNNSFDVDPANPGSDMTVAVAGDTTQLQTGLASPYPMTPAITTALQGGLTPAQKSLEISVDFSNRSQAVTVTVNFSNTYTQGVQGVSFTIFDVDFQNGGGSTFQDEIRSIRAVGADGVTLIAPTITVGPDVSLTGSGLNYVATGILTNTDTGGSSGDGNVTISFGSTAISSFTFTYGSGSGTVADPTYQHIAISDITFTPVPEINPSLAAACSCLLAAFVIRRHNARFRK